MVESGDDVSKGLYGLLPMIQSKEKMSRTLLNVCELKASLADTQVWVRGRLFVSRATGKQCFFTIRQRYHTVQALVISGEAISKQMVKFAAGVARESIIDVQGFVRKTPTKVESCTQADVELHVSQMWVVSAAEPRLPILIEDAMRPEADDDLAGVSQDTRLDNRVIDLRTSTNQAIFAVEHGVCRLFRDTLSAKGFNEIHTPKIINGNTGQESFRVTIK